MKISLTKETWLKPLQSAVGIADKKQIKPILSYLLVTLKGQKLTLVSTDTEIELRSTIISSDLLDDQVQFTVPGRKLLDICRSLPDGAPIELTVKENAVIVGSGRSKFTLSSLPVSEFPKMPEQQWQTSLEVGSDVLNTLISKTCFVIPLQDVRQYLNGLLLEVRGDLIRALATDGHRLAVYQHRLPNAKADTSSQVIVPRKTVLELAKLLSAVESSLTIDFNDNFLRVRGASFEVTSNLISGRFPGSDKIIPVKGSGVVEVEREELRLAVARVGILSGDLFRGINFKISPSLLMLDASNSQREEATEELPINYRGADLEITFNLGYIADILSAMEGSSVKVFFDKADSGVVWEEELPGYPGSLYVVMPIRK